MEKTISVHNWTINSSQRPPGSANNNFTMVIPKYFLKHTAKQRYCLKLVSFSTINTFYNIWNLKQNRFTLTYTSGSTVYAFVVELITQFATTIAAVNTAIKLSIQNSAPAACPLKTLAITARADGTVEWSWTAITLNDTLSITFPTVGGILTTTINSAVGFPDNGGAPYNIVHNSADVNLAWTFNTPFPITYSYLPNINLSLDLGSPQNYEYAPAARDFNFSTVFAKIPVNSAPFAPVWFNPQDLNSFVSLSADMGSEIQTVIFSLTDDAQQPLPMFYDWEAVIRIEILEEFVDKTIGWQDKLLETTQHQLTYSHDLENLLMSGYLDSDPQKAHKSLLVQLQEEMATLNETLQTAFLRNEKSVFVADSTTEVEGPSSIANQIRSIQGHCASMVIELGTMGLSGSLGSTINAVKDTIDSVNKFTGLMQNSLGEAIKELHTTNTQDQTFYDYMSGSTTGSWLLGTKNSTQGIKSYVAEIAQSISDKTVDLHDMDMPLFRNDIVEAINSKDFQNMDMPYFRKELVDTIVAKASPDIVEAINFKTSPDIVKAIGLTSNTWNTISTTLSTLTGYLMGQKANKILYDTEIAELSRFISESQNKDITPEVDSWVRSHENLQFDPQRSDVKSWDDMISKAITLETGIHDSHLETWIKNHAEK